MKQLLEWCGNDFDGLIVFDECHKAKNLVPRMMDKSTKTGKAVLKLQEELPGGRVVYCSATGVSAQTVFWVACATQSLSL